MRKVATTKLNAIVELDPRGGYSAYVPALPGCITEADTLSQLEINLKDAIKAWKLANKRFKIDILDTFVMPVHA